MKTFRWISIRRIKYHEFHCTLRYIKNNGSSWHDVYLRLGEMQNHATNNLLKSLSSISVIYLILASIGDVEKVSITFQGITAAIPTSYVTIVASIFVFVAIQQFQVAAMLISLRSRQSVSLRLPRFSASIYGLYHGQDEMALSVPIFASNFIKEKIPVSSMIGFLSVIVYCSLLIPFAGFIIYIASWNFTIVAESTNLINTAMAVSGLLVLFISVLYLVLFNLPFPVLKNDYGIRWGFLIRFAASTGHPQLQKWLADGEKTKK